MQNNNPRISVVMSVYNGERYLKQSIESILNQSFRDFEFLIINDDSTDGTQQILDDYREKDIRIKIIINNQNLGLTKSLNKAIRRARGNYIARMDDDDIAMKTRLEKQFEFMEDNTDIALSGSLALVIDEQGREEGKKDLAVEYKDIKKKLLFNNQFIHSSLFLRRSMMREPEIYNEEFERAQDYELVLRIAAKHIVANLPEYLIKWRKSRDSLSFSGTKQQRCAIKARWWAITKYGYPKIKGILHILLRIGYLIWPKR